jgi:hypothetical protein
MRTLIGILIGALLVGALWWGYSVWGPQPAEMAVVWVECNGQFFGMPKPANGSYICENNQPKLVGGIPATPAPTGSNNAAPTLQPTVIAQPTASQPAVPAGQQAVSCPTEAEFAQLTGVVADVVPSEPCAFHWRGDPLAIMPKDACPNGWACQLGVVQHGNVLYYGGSPSVSIYAGTWRLPAAYPLDDAVQQPCRLLAKSQEEGRQATPTWSITAGNFSCP